ncbi:hypothetical protein [Enhygromyxa salina]|uniref:hypothetical protein n=1 Tax=Enhygromyxa salina TaxID=215803 RepID=UPI0011BA9F2E|nr:hypothetical protein [Enhygromyxa salina]
MTHYYWYKACSICDGQGRLLLFMDLFRKELYLHCEECECGWRDPEKAERKEAGFLTLDEDFEAEAATRADIDKCGWQKYAVNSFDKE